MNWNMLGHEWAVNLLKEQIVSGQPRHSYLLTGPAGIGRRTLALRLAQALNCPQPSEPGEPCQVCKTCLQTEAMTHPDLALIQAEQVGGTLKVDQIRALQRSLALTPYSARYRIAVLLRFEEANPSAANALLKTLEEPPPQVILILTAEGVENLLPTIVSRCEILRLRPLPLDAASQGLQARWGMLPQQAELLAHISAGRPGHAVRFFQEPELLEQRQVYLDDLHRLLSARRLDRFVYAESLARNKESLRPALQTWSSLWRDVLLKSSGAAADITNLDRTDEVNSLAARFTPKTARQVITSLEKTQVLLQGNINARLALEVLMLDLPRL